MLRRKIIIKVIPRLSGDDCIVDSLSKLYSIVTGKTNNYAKL